MWTNKQFWLDASWRAARTWAQTLAAMLGGQAVNLFTAPWNSMMGISLTAALTSFLMSMDRERAVEWVSKKAGSAPNPTQASVQTPVGLDPPLGCGDSLQ